MSEETLSVRIDSLEAELARVRDNQDRIFTLLDSLNQTVARIEVMVKNYQQPGTTTFCKAQDSRIAALEQKVETLNIKVAWYSGVAMLAGGIISFLAQKFLGK